MFAARSYSSSDPQSTQEECEVVSDASSACGAIEKARKLQPDVVLLDISMPELNGLQAISLIKNVAPKTEILMVTQHDNRFFAVRHSQRVRVDF